MPKIETFGGSIEKERKIYNLPDKASSIFFINEKVYFCIKIKSIYFSDPTIPHLSYVKFWKT